MTTLPIRSALLLLALAPACTITKGDLGNFTDGDTDGTDGESSASTGGGTDPTNGTSGATEATSDGTASTGDTGGPACAEPSVLDQGQFTVTLDPPLPDENSVSGIVTTCTVLALDAEGDATFIALQCEDRTATIELKAGGWAPPLAVNDQVRLGYHRSMPWWENEWFTLRFMTEGSPLIAGGMSADSLFPFADDPTLFSPVQVTAHEGVCGLPTCDFPFERLAVRFDFDGASLELVDGNSGLVGQLTSFKVILADARQYHEMLECAWSDVSDRFFTALMLLVPEG